MNHTPTPWHVDTSDPDADICSEFGMVAKTMGHPNNQDDEGRENARHIVHCVNQHDALIMALKRLLLTEDGLQTGIDHEHAVNNARDILTVAEQDHL